MSLLQWCDEGPATVGLEATVEDAIRTMIDKAVGAVAVVDEQTVVAGMFTERDVLAKFALSQVDIQSQIGLCPSGVNCFDGLDEFSGRKIFCPAPGVERSQAEIHGVGPGLQSRL